MVVLLVVCLAVVPAIAMPTRSASADPVARSTPAPRWASPLPGEPAVVRPFDPPPRPWLPGHRGVDLAAEPGQTVRAAGAGVVAFAGVVAGTGVVSVQHPGGLRTTYQPVAPTVHAGEDVGLGAALGRLASGHAGCQRLQRSPPACLHWGLRRGSVYIDPMLLLRPLRVRLKPLVAPTPALPLLAPRRRRIVVSAGPWSAPGSDARTRRWCCRSVRTAVAARSRSTR